MHLTYLCLCCCGNENNLYDIFMNWCLMCILLKVSALGALCSQTLAWHSSHPVSYTVRIVATATINFSLAWVWLLIKVGSYLRAAFIYFRLTLDCVVHEDCSTEDWFLETGLGEIDIQPSKKLPCCSRTKPRLSFAMVCPERASTFHMRSWLHPLNRVRACYYSRAATISFTELHVRLLFEGGYYSSEYSSLGWRHSPPPL